MDRGDSSQFVASAIDSVGQQGDRVGNTLTRHGLIRPHTSKLSAAQRLCDVFIIIGSLAVACAVQDQSWDGNYVLIATTAAALFSTIGSMCGLYSSLRMTPVLGEMARIVATWLGIVMLFVLVHFFFGLLEPVKTSTMSTWFMFAPVGVLVWRTGWRVVLRELRKRGHNTRLVAVVGYNDLGQRLEKTLRSATWVGLRWYGFFDDRDRDDMGAAVRGDLQQLVRDARAGRVDMVYIALPLRAESRVSEVINMLSDTTASVYVVPDYLTYELLHSRSYSLGNIPVVSVVETPFYGPAGWVKEVEDMILGSLCLTVSAIPMLLIAMAIKLTTGGPVLFRQKRFGINGQEIEVWKFRTMTVAENGEAVQQASRYDPRVTRIGRFLRRTSLDELPQFFNVLQGRMSLVGPRPHALAHNEKYRREVKRYMVRHKVKPGITGWAQVNGLRGETKTVGQMQKRVEYDLEYIRSWSLFFDIKIIVLTLLALRSGDNAY
ncbi:MAG: undecaprenyl-phosphate glucose phosphotransferase [Pseudomonadota bacterium]